MCWRSGFSCREKFPELDPFTVRFTDLHKWVTELPGFAGDPAKSSEGILEAIQMAWHEEYEDAKGEDGGLALVRLCEEARA